MLGDLSSTNAHVSQCVSVLSNLCVKNGLRISLHGHWVCVWSREGVLLKILKCGLHVHCNQTGPWGSGSGVCRIRALLNHSHAVIVFEGSLQSTWNLCFSPVCVKYSRKALSHYFFVLYNREFTCFRMSVRLFDAQHVEGGHQDSSELSRTLKFT